MGYLKWKEHCEYVLRQTRHFPGRLAKTVDFLTAKIPQSNLLT